MILHTFTTQITSAMIGKNVVVTLGSSLSNVVLSYSSAETTAMANPETLAGAIVMGFRTANWSNGDPNPMHSSEISGDKIILVRSFKDPATVTAQLTLDGVLSENFDSFLLKTPHVHYLDIIRHSTTDVPFGTDSGAYRDGFIAESTTDSTPM